MMIAAIKNSDEVAFCECFFLYQKKLVAYYRKKAVPEQDIPDLVQSVFLKLWQYRHSLDESYDISQAIFQISRTVFIDHLRRQQKQRVVVQAEVREDLKIDQRSGEAFEARQQLQLALDHMPEMRRKVFVLNKLKGYSYMEIADHFSISVKSVDNHMSRALRQLRETWGILVSAIIILLLF